jgi:hypothetical protein
MKTVINSRAISCPCQFKEKITNADELFLLLAVGRFPSGIKALGDHVHSRGLKFGIYEDYGKCMSLKKNSGQKFDLFILFLKTYKVKSLITML